jgi:hypothetical protein
VLQAPAGPGVARTAPRQNEITITVSRASQDANRFRHTDDRGSDLSSADRRWRITAYRFCFSNSSCEFNLRIADPGQAVFGEDSEFLGKSPSFWAGKALGG